MLAFLVAEDGVVMVHGEEFEGAARIVQAGDVGDARKREHRAQGLRRVVLFRQQHYSECREFRPFHAHHPSCRALCPFPAFAGCHLRLDGVDFRRQPLNPR
jgi:hypothetical protein